VFSCSSRPVWPEGGSQMCNICHRRYVPILLITVLFPLFAAGCRADFAFTREDDDTPAVSAPSAPDETAASEGSTGTGGIVDVEIGGGKIVIDGDTLSNEEVPAGSIEITTRVEKEEGGDIGFKKGDVVRFGEKIKVGEGEKVRGSVVSFGADVVVRGIVTEDAVSFGGDVYVTSTGDVYGDAVAVGGQVIREEGGSIGGDEVSLGPGIFPHGIIAGVVQGPFRPHFMFSGWAKFLFWLFWLGLVIVIGLGTVLLFPRQLAAVRERVREAPVKMGFVGLLAEILILPILVLVTVILAITIIGIPLLVLVIPLFVLGVVAAFFFGYISVADVTARLVEARANLNMESPYVRVALGVLLLMIAGLIATVLGAGPAPLRFIGAFFALLSWMIFYLACTIGFGAVVASRFGSGSSRANPRPPAATPSPRETPPPPEGGAPGATSGEAEGSTEGV
jgi:hypothetical protein